MKETWVPMEVITRVPGFLLGNLQPTFPTFLPGALCLRDVGDSGHFRSGFGGVVGMGFWQ